MIDIPQTAARAARTILDAIDQNGSLTVRWLFAPGCELMENACLRLEGGTIADIRNSATTSPDNVLPVLLVPRFVNAHTHLEFSALDAPLAPARPFPDWIRAVMQSRRESNVDRAMTIRQGLDQSSRAGISVVGEIDSTGDSPLAGSTSDLTMIVFREFIGLDTHRIPQQLTDACSFLMQSASAPRVIRGLSPHAPYSVHPELLAGLIDVAHQHRAPVAMHLAETTDEIELLARGRGRLADFLKALELFDASVFPGGRNVLEQLRQLSRCDRGLVIHGNYLTNPEIEFLSEHPQLTVVYCPRTHAYFGHPEHPLRRLRAAGVRVVLGTDSRASNPDLSIWNELCFVARMFPDIQLSQLLPMITTEAAAALGLSTGPFRIEPGSRLSNLQFAVVDAMLVAGKLMTTALAFQTCRPESVR